MTKLAWEGASVSQASETAVPWGPGLPGQWFWMLGPLIHFASCSCQKEREGQGADIQQRQTEAEREIEKREMKRQAGTVHTGKCSGKKSLRPHSWCSFGLFALSKWFFNFQERILPVKATTLAASKLFLMINFLILSQLIFHLVGYFCVWSFLKQNLTI